MSPERLFPVDPATREIARQLYGLVKDLPIISPHGHVNPSLLVDDESFGNATELLLRWDHYIFRLLHADGVDITGLGVGGAPLTDPRAAWRTFCARWHLIEGTASALWLTHILVELLGVDIVPSAGTADDIYDRIQHRLDQPEFRPRALFDTFGIELMATTDDPLDDLAAHTTIRDQLELSGRVVPTWRPDKYCDLLSDGFAERIERLTGTVGGRPGHIGDYLKALEHSRQRFIAAGAISTDHGPRTPKTLDLSDRELEGLLAKGLAGNADATDAVAFEAGMLTRFAGMACQDGLVMTVHPSVARNHCQSALTAFGPDTGHDIPLRTEYTRAMQPLLNKYGTVPGFHLVLFTIDETVYSRELAPLAGFYPAVYVGAPWWFIDSPDAIGRHRSAVVEQAGFYRSSGFIDDTRAYLSIPARHDMSRRVDAAFLARYVVQGRLQQSAAERIIVDMTCTNPRNVFKLGG
nr:glucuronate isomerase [Corynebacterium mendelii]